MSAFRYRAFAFAVLAFGIARPAAAVDPGDLLKFIPTPVNAVAVVNVAGILDSPLGVRQGWAKSDRVEYLAGAIPVHPSVERLVLATEFVPHNPGHGGGLAIASSAKPIDLTRVAKTINGELTTAGGEPAVLTRTGSYMVQLAPQVLGAMRTQHKPDVSRWAQFAKTAEHSQQSAYLNKAVFNFGMKSHVMFAIDTQDLISKEQARLLVAQTKVSLADPKTFDAITRFMAGLSGIRFTANLTPAGTAATLRVDSAVPAAMPPEVMKGFVIEELNRYGATLEDLAAANARTEGNTFHLEFQVTDEELAKLMSIFLPPAAGLSEGYHVAVDPAGVTAEGSKRYFQKIDRVLDELRSTKDKGQKYETAALWYETAAHRVATTSTLNADPALVEYGQRVAGQLQAMAGSLRGVPLQVGALESSAYYYRSGGWGWWGSRSVMTNVPQVDQRIRQTIAKDQENRDKLWAAIDEDRGKVRQEMATKYKTDFSPK